MGDCSSAKEKEDMFRDSETGDTTLSKPKQYQIGIDTFERMKANCTAEEIIGGCKLNIDKYIWRKKGCDVEDLRKAKDYIDLWIWTLKNKG